MPRTTPILERRRRAQCQPGAKPQDTSLVAIIGLKARPIWLLDKGNGEQFDSAENVRSAHDFAETAVVPGTRFADSPSQLRAQG
jgi:hypothetical protein